MSRNATASWSGYSHQGKVAFLIALRKINTLNLAVLNGYTVELETQEDVRVLSQNAAVEVHQVKALLSSTTIGSYTTALAAFEPCLHVNNIHTICNITNWDDLTHLQNPSMVTRYLYSAGKQYCTLEEIDPFIIAEISSVLQLHGHPEFNNAGRSKLCFNEFLGLLDERIRTEHHNQRQDDYRVQFSLQEILDLLINPPSRFNSITCAIREKIFSQYVFFMQELTNLAFPTITDDHENWVIALIRQIGLLSDHNLELFLNQIFPDTTQGKSLGNCTLTDEFFSTLGFTSTFLYALISIENHKIILEDNSYPHYKVDFNYLLTAIQSTEIMKRSVARNILKNDKLNMVRYETDFIINENLSGNLSESAERVIPSGKGSIFSINEIELITRADAVIKLN